MVQEKLTSADCVKCGACCVSFYDQDVYCDVTREDEKRLGKKFVRLNVLRPQPLDQLMAVIDHRKIPEGAIKTKWVESKSGPLKGIEACRCIALKGSLMHKVSCSVYEKRPEVCHKAVKPGDWNCRETRKHLRRIIKELADER